MSSITCGNCKSTHDSVQAVKSCYAGAQALAASNYNSRGYEHDELSTRRPLTQGTIDRAYADRFEVKDSGIYMPTEGNVYKVYPNQTQTRMLCKKLDAQTGSWEYKGMAYRFVSLRDRISRSEAAQYGKVFGRCAICGRLLTDEQSVAQGIGPICIQKQGWAA